MIKSSYKLGTVIGIPVRVHLSLIVLLPLLASMLSPGSGILALAFGLIMAIGLFGSVALHELGHSVVALRYGCQVRQILLLPIGGIAQLQNMPQRAQAEFWIAIAGPAVSVTLWILCDLLAAGLLSFGLPTLAIVTANIGMINMILALFNMIPAFPMDGGRILRALLQPKVGRLKATEWCSGIGRMLAMMFGIYALFHGQLMSVAVAIFIYIAAGAEYKQVLAQHAQQSGFTGSPFFFGGSPRNRQPDTTVDNIEVGPPPYAKRTRPNPSNRTGFRRFF